MIPQKVQRALIFKDLLLLRIVLAVPIIYNLDSGNISNLLINHVSFIIMLLIFPNLLKAFKIKLEPVQVIWISLGLVIHPLGAAYSLYYNYGFYDAIAHFYSATLVSSILLVYLWRNDYNKKQIWVYSFLGITFLGTGWEIFERLVDDLTVYGFWDTIGDYFFNTLGWLATIKYGKNRLENVWNR